MIGALIYLRVTSLRNQAATRLARLREPKYLAGALAAAAYIYFFFLRRFDVPAHSGPGPRALPPGAAMAIGVNVGLAIAMIVMIGWVFFAWIAPSKQAGLRFSPAEIDFLFPAPVGRRTLLHYSLLSSQLTILIGAVFLGLIWSRQDPRWSAAAMRIAGWWIVMSTGELHRSGANLTYAWLRERSRNPGRVRLAAILVLGGFLAALAASVRAVHGPSDTELTSAPAMAAYLTHLLGAGALRWLLWPFRAVAGPFLAPNGRAFSAALGPALLILAIHYRWILRLEVSFAEGSIALAEKRSRVRAAAAAGTLAQSRAKAGREPFRLAQGSPPEVAFLWKNLLSINILNWRLLLILGAILIQALVIFMTTAGRRGSFHPAILISGGAALMAFYVLLAGPQIARQDFRRDLANLDLLKSYPLPGWRVVLGELLAPVAILSALLWVLLAAATWAVTLSPFSPFGLGPAERIAAALCLAAVAPAVCALELLLANAAALYFPAWFRTTQGRGGIEMMGQRLLFGLGQLLLITLALLPAALPVPVLIFASQWLIGPAPAMMLAAAAAFGVVGGELAVGIWLLGRRFERLDLAAEVRP